MVVFANAGVPMLFVGLPYMAAVLAPVIVIEAAWYWCFLRVSWSEAWRGSLNANVVTFFVGLPVAWVLWGVVGWVSVSLMSSSGLLNREQFLESYAVGFLFLVATSGWLPPTPGFGEVLLLGAGMILMLPAYLVSYLSEAAILRGAWRERDARKVSRHVWLAHVVTYGLLYLIAVWRFRAIT